MHSCQERKTECKPAVMPDKDLWAARKPFILIYKGSPQEYLSIYTDKNERLGGF